MLLAMKTIVALVFYLFHFTLNKQLKSRDPFESLGIPDINPKKLIEELDKEEKPKEKRVRVSLNKIDDLPNFLQKNEMDEDDGIELLSKFLIQDDITLKKYGVVYDQTGFDGLPDETPLAKGSEERFVQRAKSSANIWVSC